MSKTYDLDLGGEYYDEDDEESEDAWSLTGR